MAQKYANNPQAITTENEIGRKMENLKNSQEIEQQLSVVQENLDKCGLIIVNGHPVSSDTSSFYFGDTKLFISSIKKKEIRSIETLKGNSAKKFYGTAGLRTGCCNNYF